VNILQSFREFIRPYDMNAIAEERALTEAQKWARDISWGPMAAGVNVTVERAMESAIGACVRLLADDISSLPVDVYRTVNGITREADPPPWVEFPTARRWDTFQTHVSDVVVSMLSDGNAYIVCAPNTVNPGLFSVRDPETMQIEQRADGFWFRDGLHEWTEMDMAHIPWVRLPGKLKGLSPFEASRGSSGLELAAREWAGAFFENGGTLGSVIEHPGKPSQEEVDLMRESFTKRHAGSGNAWKLGVLTGGAKLAYGGRVLPREADLQPLWKQVLEAASRLYHVPPHLLGSQDPGGSSYASVEQRSIEYVQHAIVPVTTRLEATYNRFLGPGRYLKFNTNALLRGDIKSRASWYQMALTNKVMMPSEVRDKEDLPFDPANTGYLQTPNNNAPEGTQAVGDDPQAAAITISDVQLRDEAGALLSQRVTEAIVAGQEQAAADLAQMHTDILAKTESDIGAMRAEARELQAVLAAERAAQREAELLPVDRKVMRDDKGRLSGVIERKGDRVVRKVIERDDDGRVITVREVSAA